MVINTHESNLNNMLSREVCYDKYYLEKSKSNYELLQLASTFEHVRKFKTFKNFNLL